MKANKKIIAAELSKYNKICINLQNIWINFQEFSQFLDWVWPQNTYLCEKFQYAISDVCYWVQ